MQYNDDSNREIEYEKDGMVDLSLLISPPSSSEADSPKDRGLKIIENIKRTVQDLFIIAV